MNFPRPLCLVFLLPQARHVLPAVLWGVLTIVYCIVWSSWLHTPSLATTVAVLPKWWTLIQRCLGPFLLSSQTVLCRLNAGESWKRYRTHLMWLHFQRAKVGSVFDVVMCKIWVRRSGSLPSVLNYRSCFSQCKGPLYGCLLIRHLPSGSTSRMDILDWQLLNSSQSTNLHNFCSLNF